MYPHPPERHIRDLQDALMKIADILYFFKKGEADEGKTKKRLVFLKVVTKKKLSEEELKELEKEIENSLELLEKFGTLAYDKYLEHLKKEHSEVIERFEKARRSSLLGFLK